MPGAASGACGCKVVCVRPENRARGLPTVPAVYVDVDEETGVPAALVDGQALTYFRTGAASGVAAKYLAKKCCKTLLVVGTGVQGTAGCEAVLCVRKFERVIGVDGYAPSLEKFREKMQNLGLECETHPIDEIERFVPLADVILTTTTSPRPLFDGTLVRPGTFVSCVGAF